MAAKTSTKKNSTAGNKKKTTNTKSGGKGASANGKKNQTSGKKSSSKSSAKSAKEGSLQEEKKVKIRNNPAGSRMRDNIVAVLLVAFGIFLIIAVLTDSVGKVGEVLSTALKGSLGVMAMILPFYLIVYALLILMGKMAHVNSRSVFFTLLMFLDLTMMNAARFSEVKSAAFDLDYVRRMFSFGLTYDSAGAVGMTLGWLVVKAVDIVGLLLIGVVIIIICVMLIADTPISSFFDNQRIKKNQKKINELSEKTKSGFADHRKDTVEIPAVGTDTKKKRRRGSDGSAETVPMPDFIPKPGSVTEEAEGRTSYYYETDHLLTDLREDHKLDEAADLLGRSSREVSRMNQNSRRPAGTAEAPLGNNRRQILGYMNDGELFNGDNTAGQPAETEPSGRPARNTASSGAGGHSGFRKPGESYGQQGTKTDFADPGQRAKSADLRPLSEGRGVDDLIREFSPEFEGEDLSIKKKNRSKTEGTAAGGTGISGSSIRRLDKKTAGVPQGSASASAGPDGESVQSSGRTDFGSLSGKGSAISGDTSGNGQNRETDEEDAMLSAMEEAALRATSKRSRAADSAAAAAGAAVIARGIDREQPPEKTYELPPLRLLEGGRRSSQDRAALYQSAELLETVLRNFGVEASVINVSRGPSVTRYEVQPATGVKVSKIVNLADDIALNLRAKSLRIEAPIPGKAAVGIEIENDHPDTVKLRDMIDSEAFRKEPSKIAFAVGEDIAGNPVVANLKKMPHMLIAGSTGSGKSVCINSILISMLYRSTPDEVRFILIDPKVVELSNYNGIPHMLIPVVSNPAKAAAALAWAVKEMEDRYRKFARESVREMASYNKKMQAEGRDGEVLPQIVIVIDELADLMMAAGKQVEESICRLAQLARAAGMHMIVATQRPSVDVVTGLIKSNIPSRIAFAVSSQVDSRTIIDRAGAEKLIGNGDMLFNPLGISQPQRLQGPFVSDEEIEAVLDFWKAQADLPDPDELKDSEQNAQAARDSVETKIVSASSSQMEEQQRILAQMDSVLNGYGNDEEEDELMEDAIALILDSGQASASMLQRRFRIGYNRAGRLIDTLEAKGIIGPSEGSKPRKVLISKEEYYASGQPEVARADAGSDLAATDYEGTEEDGMVDGESREVISIPDFDEDLSKSEEMDY